MKVTFLIDGFNLYHSLDDAQKDHGTQTKWLNISSLMESYLRFIDKEAIMGDIYFFTALRNHVRKKNPKTVKRHERYLKMLEGTGVKIVHGNFKEGTGFCKRCNRSFKKYEEKETDVNIAVKLVELAYSDSADVFVIVSGDTDLVPGIDVVNRSARNKKVFVIYPYGRKNDEFKKRVTGHFKLNKEAYLRHQFEDKVVIDSVAYNKPEHW